MFKAHFRALFVALIALPMLLTGCDEIIGSDSIEGTYQFVTYNGRPMPAISHGSGGFRYEYIRGSLTLREGGDATLEIETRTTDTIENVSEDEHSEESGTYTVAGDRLTLSLDEGAEVVEGSIDGGKITFVGNEEIYVFRK